MIEEDLEGGEMGQQESNEVSQREEQTSCPWGGITSCTRGYWGLTAGMQLWRKLPGCPGADCVRHNVTLHTKPRQHPGLLEAVHCHYIVGVLSPLLHANKVTPGVLNPAPQEKTYMESLLTGKHSC